jgi:hypothetical protein
MNIKFILCFMLLLTPVAVSAQSETGLNGRHVGPYSNGGNPYSGGSGLAPGFRTSEGNPVFINQQSSTPPPLPARPLWTNNLPTDGHSLQYSDWAKIQKPIQLNPILTNPVQTTVQPSTSPAVTQPTQAPFTGVRPADAIAPTYATYASTLQEMMTILGYDGKFSTPFDYLSWYLKGAQIDPKQILQGSDDWLETFFRHFVAEDLVSMWNVTMQDTFLRVVVPFLLAIGLWKGIEFAFSKIFEDGRGRI